MAFDQPLAEDAAGVPLPAPLTKMGSFSGKNNARDFARSVRLPVVLCLRNSPTTTLETLRPELPTPTI